MNPLELAASAARAIAEPGTVGLVLTIQKGGMPRGFPRGELLNEAVRAGRIERTYSFDPHKVIAWLIRNELVVMERTGPQTLSFRETSQGSASTHDAAQKEHELDLQPHQQRVVAEKDEVSERLSKLYAFFQGPIFPTLSEAERTRLRSQARFMDGYAAVLEERIAAFTNTGA